MARSSAKLRTLDPTIRGEVIDALHTLLSRKIIGQPRAVDCLTWVYQQFATGLTPENKPVATLLFAGPTGAGKTYACETLAEILLEAKHPLTRIDCAEFQHSHEISKLIGSPPGYLGFNEVPGALAQDQINQYQTTQMQLNFVLFDEIEKASPAVWQLLLGVMDNARLTLGNGKKTDFSRTVLVMTTNLGAKEMESLTTGGGIGFRQLQPIPLDKIAAVADNAITRNFSPEFVNRLTEIVVFNQLSRTELEQILDIELDKVQNRILSSRHALFALSVKAAAKEFLLDKGTDIRYGARELKRTIERYIVQPISSIISGRQLTEKDTLVVVDRKQDDDALSFEADTV